MLNSFYFPFLVALSFECPPPPPPPPSSSNTAAFTFVFPLLELRECSTRRRKGTTRKRCKSGPMCSTDVNLFPRPFSSSSSFVLFSRFLSPGRPPKWERRQEAEKNKETPFPASNKISKEKKQDRRRRRRRRRRSRMINSEGRMI